ncbi:hypothetical protein [Helicobacter didelphidarum]|uniref:hypothetical protein n=1 Tax=Helicobacter didelphidarum TaxID=2040648 RepID=UPI0015F17CF8|nr:hypothetical protein [Helicobacter didelphidarum]
MTNKTNEAKLDLVKKFLDYAHIANASYAMLHYTEKKYELGKDDKSDGLKLGDKLNNTTTNTTYARCIEARFNQDKIIGKEGDYCFPFTKACLSSKDKTLSNNPANVALDAPLSQETIEFTNRYKLLAHQQNTASGFSATLFEDRGELIDKETNTRKVDEDSKYVLAIRGTEFPNDIINDILDADKDLAFGILPKNQYLDMLKFYLENL